ncbi:hypothetical protein POTOM_046374 [Populus tomentosa]|uniref:Remorin C-terminal domain-containing protein n=1 Tax=Populus tomentosa TaxID=118781 RepID=A0A8X8CCH7_POPTO|nr:hypothetical protein POTOM_046374 [Populus tomentosa]
MRTTACKNISQYNTTTHRAKPTINPLSIAKNKASRYYFPLQQHLETLVVLPQYSILWLLLCSPLQYSSFHFCVSLDDGIATQNCHSKYRSRQSAVADAEVYSRTLSSFLDDDNEKKHDDSDPKCNYNINSSDTDSVDCGNHKLMTRPKPYSDFLDEIKAQELEAQMGAWKKAKHRELMNKLRRNEAVIRDWEYKQTQKALKDMRKVENKLERKRAEALERAQKRINKARKEAN